MALLVALVADGSTIGDLARAVSIAAFTIWAYEEAANGVNSFRRGLGVVGLALVVAALTSWLG